MSNGPYQILVTGGAGFVGSRVVAELTAAGHTVVSYDLAERADGALGHSVHGSIGDPLRLAQSLADWQIERVVHAAAFADPGKTAANPVATVDTNVLGTAKVFEVCRQARVSRVVHVSSEAVYGHVPDADSMTEDTPYNPTTAYGAAKAAAEILASVYRRQYALEIVCVRLAEVYGPWLPFRQPVRDMLAAAVNGELYHEPTGADQPQQLIYIDDAATALRCAVEAPAHDRLAYHVSDGVRYTWGSIRDAVAARHPGANIALGPGLSGGLCQPRWELSAARRDLGFEPAWPLQRALPIYELALANAPALAIN